MMEEDIEKNEKKERFLSAVGDVVGMQRLPNGGCQVVVNINPLPYPERPKDAAKVSEYERRCLEIDNLNYTMVRGLRFDRVDLVQNIVSYDQL